MSRHDIFTITSDRGDVPVGQPVQDGVQILKSNGIKIDTRETYSGHSLNDTNRMRRPSSERNYYYLVFSRCNCLVGPAGNRFVQFLIYQLFTEGEVNIGEDLPRRSRGK